MPKGKKATKGVTPQPETVLEIPYVADIGVDDVAKRFSEQVRLHIRRGTMGGYTDYTPDDRASLMRDQLWVLWNSFGSRLKTFLRPQYFEESITYHLTKLKSGLTLRTKGGYTETPQEITKLIELKNSLANRQQVIYEVREVLHELHLSLSMLQHEVNMMESGVQALSSQLRAMLESSDSPIAKQQLEWMLRDHTENQYHDMGQGALPNVRKENDRFVAKKVADEKYHEGNVNE
jgi:hypothetical protein